jgi:hypothetical protein
MYSKGLSEAAIHAEIYRILHSLFRNQHVRILTETKVVKSSDMRCDIWIKTQALTEFGIEFKTELNNKEIQEAASGQLLKYASSRSPREMILVNFVYKEAASVIFPINIKPTGWEKHSSTNFSVLFVLVLGDVESGLQFRFASNGDCGWTDVLL